MHNVFVYAITSILRTMINISQHLLGKVTDGKPFFFLTSTFPRPSLLLLLFSVLAPSLPCSSSSSLPFLSFSSLLLFLFLVFLPSFPFFTVISCLSFLLSLFYSPYSFILPSFRSFIPLVLFRSSFLFLLTPYSSPVLNILPCDIHSQSTSITLDSFSNYTKSGLFFPPFSNTPSSSSSL